MCKNTFTSPLRHESQRSTASECVWGKISGILFTHSFWYGPGKQWMNRILERLLFEARPRMFRPTGNMRERVG